MSGLSESEKAKMNALAGKIVPALAAVTAGASALAVLGNLLVSNYEKITPAGDVVMKPTKQETDLQSSKTGASSNDAVVAKDDVSAQKGNVDATKQQADANTTDALIKTDFVYLRRIHIYFISKKCPANLRDIFV